MIIRMIDCHAQALQPWHSCKLAVSCIGLNWSRYANMFSFLFNNSLIYVLSCQIIFYYCDFYVHVCRVLRIMTVSRKRRLTLRLVLRRRHISRMTKQLTKIQTALQGSSVVLPKRFFLKACSNSLHRQSKMDINISSLEANNIYIYICLQSHDRPNSLRIHGTKQWSKQSQQCRGLGHFGDAFFRPDDQTNSVKDPKETSWSSRSVLNPARTTPPCYDNSPLGNRLYARCKGFNVTNPICWTRKNCSCKCAADCEHCVTQFSTEQFW